MEVITLILLAAALAAVIYLIVRQRSMLRQNERLEQRLAQLQETVQPEAAQEQTRRQLEQLELRLRQQEQSSAAQTQTAVVGAVSALGQGLNTGMATLTGSLGENIRTMSGELKSGMETMKTAMRQSQEAAAQQQSEKLGEIDAMIARHANGWRTDRIAPVSRNILRLCVYEMQWGRDVPMVVAVNEAIELDKKFDDPKAKAFVNGVLNGVKVELEAGKPETAEAGESAAQPGEDRNA